MRKIIFLIIFQINVIFPQEEKLRLSILDFIGENVPNTQLGMCTNRLETIFVDSKQFKVIAKGERDKIVDEQASQLKGCFDEACFVEIGKLLLADHLVTGEIIATPVDDETYYQINISIFDIEQGIFTERVTDAVEGGFTDLIDQIEKTSQKIIRKMLGGRLLPTSVTPGAIALEIAYGNVKIETTPPGAQILIDYKEYGMTPQEIRDLQAGTCNLTIVHPDYERIIKSIDIIPDSTIVVIEKLAYKMGSLKVDSKPPGAFIYLDGSSQPVEKTPHTFLALPVGDHLLRILLENHVEIIRKVEVPYNDINEEMFILEPKPVSLAISTHPTEVDVIVNGKTYNSGVMGFKVIEVLPGKYEIEFSKKGYEPLVREITIKLGDEEEIEIILKKLPTGVTYDPNKGFLSIDSNVEDATIEIAGLTDKLKTPIRYHELPEGSYILEISAPEYKSRTESFTVYPQKTTELKIELTPMFGFLSVLSNINSANLKIINYKSGLLTPLETYKLPTGNYELEISAPEYDSKTESFTITPGETTELSIPLIPNFGFVSIFSNVEDSEVKIIGRKSGLKTPLNSYKLSEGNYVAEISSKGYESKRQSFTITPQKPIELNIDLTPKSSIKAMMYSILLPGSGQRYFEQKIKGNLLTSATLGTLLFGCLNIVKYRELEDEYDLANKNYIEATTHAKINSAFSERRTAYNGLNKARALSYISFATTGIFYVSNVVDALVTGGYPSQDQNKSIVKAICLSAMSPGLGQLYLGHKIKGILWYSGVEACLASIIYTTGLYYDRKDDYEQAKLEYTQANDNIDEAYVNMNSAYDKLKNANQHRTYSYFAAGAIYAMNLVDIWFTFSRGKRSSFYDYKRDKLQLSMLPHKDGVFIRTSINW